ncbi:uncharacterized protein LOC111400305 [Olea europaea var. sylvestris]|uniref:uncharacterized protein LOC111400305 n=1 Tax=Olea europaea var. sylvestris TaxID=158386 RepID=UPI000C1CECE9|nr:uncharacterized protein LOC111400305 [Olea europaea var. sylvestris]
MSHQRGNLEHNAQPENVPRGGIPLGFGNQAGRAQEPIVNEEDMLFGDFMNPPVVENESSIVYPPYGHPNIQLRPDVISLFSNTIPFYGRIDENPHSHVARFIENVGNFKYEGVNVEMIQMRLFVHTLKDKAREWLETLPLGSINSWLEFIQKFTTKFFPPARVAKLKHDITTFQQSEFESFHETWERFKDMFQKYPNQGITMGQQVNYFYAGLTPSCRSNVDSSSNGSIKKKSIRETYDLFEVMSEQSAKWPERGLQRGVGGVRDAEAFSMVLAKIDSLAKNVEGLSTSTSSSHFAHMVQSLPICDICGANHPSPSCPLIGSGSASTEQVAYTQNFQRQGYNPYSQTYNLGWRNHLNFSYENNQNVLNPKPQEKKEGWEEAIAKLANHQLQYQERNDASLKNLEC